MSYSQVKVYSDGSHYIGIPYEPNPRAKRRRPCLTICDPVRQALPLLRRKGSHKRPIARAEYAAYTAGAQAHGGEGRAVCKRFSANARPAALQICRIALSYHGAEQPESLAVGLFVCALGRRPRREAPRVTGRRQPPRQRSRRLFITKRTHCGHL